MDEIYFKPILTFIIGVFLLVFIKARKERTKRILQNCQEVKGTIVENKLEYHENSQRIYYPIIRFKIGDDWVVKKYSDGQSRIKYPINQKVIIRYSLNDPEEFLIKDDKINWNEWIILGVGFALILYSFFLFYKVYFA